MRVYAIHDFQRDFPDDDACLEYIFKKRYPDAKGYYRIKSRKAYVNKNGQHLHPLKGTIFEQSSTPLWKWFYIIFLFSASKNGVSAKEIERQIRVTYKCAWRMAYQIRSVMTQDNQGKLFGIVETDETYIGGVRRTTAWAKAKSPVVGMVQRDGKLRAKVLEGKGEDQIIPFVYKNLRKGSTLYTDYAPVYNIAKGYKRGRVKHSWREFKRGDIHTNTIEAFWGQLKRTMRGTYVFASKQHLQHYVDEAVWRWNHRKQEHYFDALMDQISQHPRS